MRILIKQVLNPILSRLGTILAVWLTANSVDAETAQQIVNGIMALALVLADLGLSAFFRRKNEEGAIRDALDRDSSGEPLLPWQTDGFGDS